LNHETHERHEKEIQRKSYGPGLKKAKTVALRDDVFLQNEPQSKLAITSKTFGLFRVIRVFRG
jgi:hypothetical protein